jgi:hypothetical protein
MDSFFLDGGLREQVSLHGGRSVLLQQEEEPTAEAPQLNTLKGSPV